VPNHTPFRPAWWLPGPHLPTIWGKFGRKVAPAHDRIEQWSTPDGDRVSVALIDPPAVGAPTLVLLHGLEGTVRSTYAQGLMHQARARGWGAAMLIFRTCDGRIPDVPRLYHSGETTDADFVIRTLVARDPDSRLFCVGVSLGGNVLLKWLGERGDDVPRQVGRAAAISTPFDLGAGARHLEHGLARIYSWHFVRTLKRKGIAALTRHPNLPVDRARMDASRTFWEFDDSFTAPVHGFSGAAEYYDRSSSIHYLPKVKVPTLLLSAEDDPFLPPVVLERVRDVARSNPRLEVEFTASGGHVGWVSGPIWAPRYQMEGRVISWLASETVAERLNGVGDERVVSTEML